MNNDIITAFDTLASVAGGIIEQGEFKKISSDNIKVSKIEHEELDFYCMDIKGSAFLIKSNNKISITGNCHHEAGAWLFQTLKKEYIESGELTASDLAELNHSLKKVAEKTYEHESIIVDMIFEEGKIPGVTNKQLNNFIQSRVDLCLENLGYQPVYLPEYNPIAGWFYRSIAGSKMTDFFVSQSSDYNRDWSEAGFIWSQT